MINKKNIKLSPNSLSLFLECPACFWLEKREQIKRPLGYSYLLNLELDSLLKDEFDTYRRLKHQPPVLESAKIKANLFANQKLLNQWRNKEVGLRYYDDKLDAILFGVIDDILESENGVLSPLDYKSTAKSVEKVYDSFQLQLDIYSFLLEKNGFKTSKTGYFVFYVVNKNKGFIDRIPFKKEILQVKTNSVGIYDIFKDAVKILRDGNMPKHSPDCTFALWADKVKNFT